MGSLGAMVLVASLFGAPVQVSFAMPMVRVGETAPVLIQWSGAPPEGAWLDWEATAGEVRAAGAGEYEYVPPEVPGRAFIHLTVTTPGGVWAESAAAILVYRQFVLLKADDLVRVPEEGWDRWVRYMDEVVLRRGIKTAAGAIGQRMSLPTEEVRAQVKAWCATGLVELFNHGYDHAYYLPPAAKSGLPQGTTYEFQGRPYDEQLAHLQRTQQIIRDNYGVQMRTFGAPFNKWDAETARAMSDLDQVDIWFFGPAGPECFVMSRGGGEIEGPDGVPSLDVFRQSHDPRQRVVVLQHHPYSAQFWEGWDGFNAILDLLIQQGATFILPGEYVDLVTRGVFPPEKDRLLPDAALECAARMALGKWRGELLPADLASAGRLEWVGRLPQVKSLSGLEHFSALRELDLRGNGLTDIEPVIQLWRSNHADMTVHWEGNPVSEQFDCETVPHFEAQGLTLTVTGPCDNVLLTLRVEGNGAVDMAPGEHIVPRGAELSLHAHPATGWRVENWEGAADAAAADALDLNMVSSRTITVRFATVPPPSEGEGEVTPVEGETPPAEGEVTPAEGETPPAEGEVIPVEGEPPPAEGEVTPVEGETPPAEGEVTPVEGETPPAEGEVTPVEGEEPPAEGEVAPAEGESIENESVGCHGATCPADGSQPVSWLGDFICWMGGAAAATAQSFRK